MNEREEALRSRYPELVAAEQSVITHADGLLTWMTHEVIPEEEFRTRVDREKEKFVTYDRHLDTVESWKLDLADPDAQRILAELLRACWKRRVWLVRLGLRERT